MFKVPSYNRALKYSLDGFEDHPMQDLMALFISKRQEDITESLKSTSKFNYEDVFFLAFYRFISPYINLDTLPIDTLIYFQSSSEQSAATKVPCAGVGKKSCSYGNGFRRQDKSSSTKDRPRTMYFEEKYEASIRGEKDQRVFLDEPHIWNILATGKYVMPEKWRNIANSAYDDATLTEKIPRTLNKHLVPLDIRNKVVQKHKHCGNTSILALTKDKPDSDTEAETGSEDETITRNTKKIEIDADMQKILDEEGW